MIERTSEDTKRFNEFLRRNERLSNADCPTLKFVLTFVEPCAPCEEIGKRLGPEGRLYLCPTCGGAGHITHRIKGREVPFSNFVVGDLTDMAHKTEEFLTRLLGMPVKIETGEE